VTEAPDVRAVLSELFLIRSRLFLSALAGAVVMTTRASGDDAPRSDRTKRRTLAYCAEKP
jgi:hypothetical protein